MVTNGLAALMLSLAAAPSAAAPIEQPPHLCGGWGLVFFDSGSAAVTPRAAAILDNFANGLAGSTYPSRVIVRGHADRLGSSESNLFLSRQRAESVADYLTARGLPASMTEVLAVGETIPLVETPDGVAEPQNRYVEFSEIPDPAESKQQEASQATREGPAPVC